MPDEGGYIYPTDASVVENVGFWATVQTEGASYNRYNIRQHLVTNYGLMQLPTAGPVGTPARIVRVHAPCSSKVVTWVIERLCEVGEKPVLPHWDTLDSNEVCIMGEVRIDAPVLQMNGSVFLWHVAGEYHYASGYAGRIQASGGTSPAITLPPEAFGINEGDFSKDYIRSVSGSVKGGTVFAGLVFDSALV